MKFSEIGFEMRKEWIKIKFSLTSSYRLRPLPRAPSAAVVGAVAAVVIAAMAAALRDEGMGSLQKGSKMRMGFRNFLFLLKHNIYLLTCVHVSH